MSDTPRKDAAERAAMDDAGNITRMEIIWDEMKRLERENANAMKTLWNTGLSPHRYHTIELAAEGAAEIIRCLRAHLDNPPPDVHEKVLKMHEGSLNAGLAKENARLWKVVKRALEAAQSGHIICPALTEIVDMCEEALKVCKP